MASKIDVRGIEANRYTSFTLLGIVATVVRLIDVVLVE